MQRKIYFEKGNVSKVNYVVVVVVFFFLAIMQSLVDTFFPMNFHFNNIKTWS